MVKSEVISDDWLDINIICIRLVITNHIEIAFACMVLDTRDRHAIFGHHGVLVVQISLVFKKITRATIECQNSKITSSSTHEGELICSNVIACLQI